MSTLKIYSVKDAKAEVFNAPFFNLTHGQAERNFEILVNDPKSNPHQFPKDFDLYHIGTFDERTGKLEPCAPEHLVAATQLKRSEK